MTVDDSNIPIGDWMADWIDQEGRAMFEKWAAGKHYPLERSRFGQYECEHASVAWDAFMAGLRIGAGTLSAD